MLHLSAAGRRGRSKDKDFSERQEVIGLKVGEGLEDGETIKDGSSLA